MISDVRIQEYQSLAASVGPSPWRCTLTFTTSIAKHSQHPNNRPSPFAKTNKTKTENKIFHQKLTVPFWSCSPLPGAVSTSVVGHSPSTLSFPSNRPTLLEKIKITREPSIRNSQYPFGVAALCVELSLQVWWGTLLVPSRFLVTDQPYSKK